MTRNFCSFNPTKSCESVPTASNRRSFSAIAQLVSAAPPSARTATPSPSACADVKEAAADRFGVWMPTDQISSAFPPGRTISGPSARGKASGCITTTARQTAACAFRCRAELRKFFRKRECRTRPPSRPAPSRDDRLMAEYGTMVDKATNTYKSSIAIINTSSWSAPPLVLPADPRITVGNGGAQFTPDNRAIVAAFLPLHVSRIKSPSRDDASQKSYPANPRKDIHAPSIQK